MGRYRHDDTLPANTTALTCHHQPQVAGLATEIGRLSLVLQGTGNIQEEARTSMQQQLYRSMSLLDVHTRQLQELLAGPSNNVDDQDALSALEGRKTKRLFTDRVCADCCTQFTSQWRSGPLGPSTYSPPRLTESLRDCELLS
jgi:hypothetical protein